MGGSWGGDRTRDLGKTWVEITRGLPADVYAHIVKEDPEHRGLLFAGTERAAWMSFDDGDTWQSIQLNLPVTSVRDFLKFTATTSSSPRTTAGSG